MQKHRFHRIDVPIGCWVSHHEHLSTIGRHVNDDLARPKAEVLPARRPRLAGKQAVSLRNG
jgi:hypothetical protein